MCIAISFVEYKHSSLQGSVRGFVGCVCGLCAVVVLVEAMLWIGVRRCLRCWVLVCDVVGGKLLRAHGGCLGTKSR